MNTEQTSENVLRIHLNRFGKSYSKSLEFFFDLQDDELVNKHLLKHFNISLDVQKLMVVIKILDTKVSQKTQ